MPEFDDPTAILTPMHAPTAPPPTYVFTGLAPFIDAAAASAGFAEWGLISRAKSLWPATQAANSLGVMPTLRPADRAALLARVLEIRAMVAVLLDGIDAATLEVITKLEMPTPAEIAGRNTDVAGRSSRPGDHDVRDEFQPVQDGRAEGDPGQPGRRGGKRAQG